MGGHGLAASHSTSLLSKPHILGGARGGSCFLEVEKKKLGGGLDIKKKIFRGLREGSSC